MGQEAVANAVREHFGTQLAASAYPTTPVAYDNVDHDPAENAAWMRYTFMPGKQFQVGMAPVGQRRWRTPGVVSVQIFVPRGAGDGLARALVDVVDTIFKGTTIGTATFRAPVTERVGPDGPWEQYNVTTEFYYDTIS